MTALNSNYNPAIRADSILTFTGKHITPLELTPEMVDIRDIAHALAAMPRFSGHTIQHGYSVAQHSVYASYRAIEEYQRKHEDPTFSANTLVMLGHGRDVECVKGSCREVGLAGLLHDASEAYLHDIPRPLKVRGEFLFYRQAELRITATIFGALNAPMWPFTGVVKIADNRLLVTEARDLMPAVAATWNLPFEPYERTIRPWGAEAAEEAFLRRFEQLTGGTR